VDLQKEPARFDQEGFQAGDAELGFEIGGATFDALGGSGVGIDPFLGEQGGTSSSESQSGEEFLEKGSTEERSM
jgi:hypothetical protein